MGVLGASRTVTKNMRDFRFLWRPVTLIIMEAVSTSRENYSKDILTHPVKRGVENKVQ